MPKTLASTLLLLSLTAMPLLTACTRVPSPSGTNVNAQNQAKTNLKFRFELAQLRAQRARFHTGAQLFQCPFQRDAVPQHRRELLIEECKFVVIHVCSLIDWPYLIRPCPLH